MPKRERFDEPSTDYSRRVISRLETFLGRLASAAQRYVPEREREILEQRGHDACGTAVSAQRLHQCPTS